MDKTFDSYCHLDKNNHNIHMVMNTNLYCYKSMLQGEDHIGPDMYHLGWSILLFHKENRSILCPWRLKQVKDYYIVGYKNNLNMCSKFHKASYTIEYRQKQWKLED